MLEKERACRSRDSIIGKLITGIGDWVMGVGLFACTPMRIRLPGSFTGRLCSHREFINVKIAVFAPMPRVSVITEMSKKLRDRRDWRRAYPASWRRFSSQVHEYF